MMIYIDILLLIITYLLNLTLKVRNTMMIYIDILLYYYLLPYLTIYLTGDFAGASIEQTKQ
jgi:hypothetical protein